MIDIQEKLKEIGPYVEAADDDMFECVWSGKLRCTLNKDAHTDKIEKLFLCKG